jgi:hypothetical protein
VCRHSRGGKPHGHQRDQRELKGLQGKIRREREGQAGLVLQIMHDRGFSRAYEELPRIER